MRHDLGWDLGVSAAAAAGWLTLDLLGSRLAMQCRWCDRSAVGADTLNGIDRAVREALRWEERAPADVASDVLSFGAAPLSALGLSMLVALHDDRLSEYPVDALLIVESTLVASFVNQLVKMLVARERPDVHARSSQERAARAKLDDNLSFFSGHTTLGFVLATSSGTVASMRGYRLAPLIWAAGLTVACASGYLRIAADRHYAIDVVTGALLGAAAGFAIPYLFHNAEQARPDDAPARMHVITIGGAF